MYSAVIIDDESKVRDTLRQMLTIYCPSVKVVGEADSVAAGYELVNTFRPAVVFLDIQLVDGSGFDLISKFENPSFQVIIITAYQEYAIEAFKFSALDYLLKPIDFNDLINAVERLSKTDNIQESKTKFKALEENIKVGGEKKGKLVLKTSDDVYIVDIDTVVRCEAFNNTTVFFLDNSATIKVSKTLKEYEDLLSPKNFFRCHQSHLINRKHIDKVMRYPVAQVIMDDGSEIPISVRKKGLI